MDYPSPADPTLFGSKSKVKPNHYATAQVMDGPMLVGTIDYGYPGWVATVLETGETQWFARKDAARTWIVDQRSEISHQNKLEQDLNVRFAWHGYDGE